MKKILALFVCSLCAFVGYATSLNSTITITQENINLINDAEGLLIGKLGDVTFSDIDLEVNVGTARFSFMNAGKVKIASDAYLTFITNYNQATYATTYAGEMEVSGNITFWHTTAAATVGYPLWLGYEYTTGGVTYSSAPMTIKNGGVVKVCGTTTPNTLARTKIYSTSSLTIEGGGSFYTQSLELYDKAVVTFSESSSGFHGNIAETISPFIILYNDTARGGSDVKINFADGFEFKGNSIIFQDSCKASIYLDENKNSNLKLTTFRSYSKVQNKATEINFYNFANDYIILTDTANMISTNEDGSIITVTALTGNYIDQTCKFIAHVGDETYVDGWYLEATEGGYYLNNSNVIPEPAAVAAVAALVALGFAFYRRRVGK